MIKVFQKAIAKIARGLLTIHVYLCFRPKVKYLDKSVKHTKEPIILVGNHTSHNDGIMTSVVFSRFKASIMVAKDWYDRKAFNWFLSNNRCIPMDRFGVDTTWLKYSREAIKNGESVIIYPEGRTGKAAEPREFKPGFIMLAIMSGAKIVPYAVNGKYSKFFGKRSRVLVGAPLELTEEGKGLKADYLTKESEKYRQAVIELMEQLEK